MFHNLLRKLFCLDSSHLDCKDKLTFNEAAGTITIKNDTGHGSTPTQTCLDSEFVGATTIEKTKKFSCHSRRN